MSKVTKVCDAALKELYDRGVRDVHARISASRLPEGKPGFDEAEAAASKSALEALRLRGLTAIAAQLEADLVPAPATVPPPSPEAPAAPAK